MQQLTTTDKAICAQTGVTEEQFAAAKAKRAATIAAPQAKVRAGFVSVNSGDDGGSDLSECCENGTMQHLVSHRDSINSEIARRNGDAHGIRFAK